MQFGDGRGELAAKYLRICPGCDRIGLQSEAACAECGWHGPFETDASSLSARLRMLYSENESLSNLLARRNAGAAVWKAD